MSFGSPTFGELSLTECAVVLRETAKRLNDGDLSAAVTMLSCQAVTLNAMFGELARRAGLNMGENLGATETYMRLALKAQSQCRATLETLAAIKNPPIVLTRQTNINVGQQQVNNGAAPIQGQARAGAHAGPTASAPNELLEDGSHGSKQLDTRAAATTGRGNQGLEAVGEVNRPADARR